MIGGGGADVILGGLGDDVFTLNSSNITALVSNTPVLSNVTGELQLARIDGGAGIDALRVDGVAVLDFSKISQIAAGGSMGGSRISSIEKIDLSADVASNTLKIKAADVVDLAGINVFNNSNSWINVSDNLLSSQVTKHQLVVNGNQLDSVVLRLDAGSTSQWSKATGTVSNNGISYDIWNHDSGVASQLLIQQGVQVSQSVLT